jgi:large subunit ribosomal protein L29
MKRKDIQQLRNATPKELETRVAETRAKLRDLRFEKAVGKIKNAHELTVLKKDIARMLTFLNMQK